MGLEIVLIQLRLARMHWHLESFVVKSMVCARNHSWSSPLQEGTMAGHKRAPSDEKLTIVIWTSSGAEIAASMATVPPQLPHI
jgi:hypothetical protein